jgi:thiamine kinase-like enzyme
MREYGADLRHPYINESWSWVLDNSQFGSDGHWLPSGENLCDERQALLLEYLPSTRRTDITSIDRELALQALAGAQSIQQALVRHGDQVKRNLLVTEEGRVVWIDFDRSQVRDKMTDDLLVRFKKDLIEIYNMLFFD